MAKTNNGPIKTTFSCFKLLQGNFDNILIGTFRIVCLLTPIIKQVLDCFHLYLKCLGQLSTTYERVLFRSSHPGVLLEKGVLKICRKFTEEHPCRSAISIKLLCNFIKITLQHGFSPVYLLHIFRTPFLKIFCAIITKF